MPTINLKNVSFNKLKEFTSLANKKNITIKGKFTLIGEYDVITKDGGDDMTIKQMLNNIMLRLDKIEQRMDKIEQRMDKIEQTIEILEIRLDKIVKLNNLKE